MRRIECPVCSSGNTTKELDFKDNSRNVTFYRCIKCELIFHFKKTNIGYGEGYYKRGKIGLLKKIENTYVYFSNLYKKLIVSRNTRGISKIKILDIGCGRGDFLSVLGKNYIKEGLEKECTSFNSHTANIKMHYIPVERFKVSESEKYDVVTLWHVLEHFDNPNKAIRMISKVIKKNGIIMLSTPNTDSLGYKLAKKDWYHFDFPYHNNLFNKKSLSYLASTNNLEIKSFIKHPLEFPLDLLWSIIKSKQGISYLLAYPFMKLLSQETTICIFNKK